MKVKIKACDTWFSRCIRHRDNWTCQKCGKQYDPESAGGLDCSHTFSRRFRATRWASENCLSLCMGCHRFFHEQPTESGIWVRELMGKKAYELLKEKKEQIVKVSKAEEREIAAHYRAEYRRMVAENSRELTSWQ